MTVEELLQKESNIAECVFFDSDSKFVDFEFTRNYSRLLFIYGNKNVISYTKAPYFDGNNQDSIKQYLSGEKTPILYVLKITLDTE